MNIGAINEMPKKKTTKKPAKKKPPAAPIEAALSAVRVPIDQIEPDPRNARTHQSNLAAIVASFKEFGQDQSILVNQRNNKIVAGHGRLAAAQKLGWSHIAVVFVDLSDKDHLRRALADNRTAELAEWDDDLLAELLDEIDVDADDELATALLLDELRAEEEDAEEGAKEEAPGGHLAPDKFEVVIDCTDEEEQERWYKKLKRSKAKCRRVTG